MEKAKQGVKMTGKKVKRPVMEGLKPENEVTDAERETLLDMVKNCPSLWDTNCAEYKKTKESDLAWLQFTKKMGFGKLKSLKLF